MCEERTAVVNDVTPHLSPRRVHYLYSLWIGDPVRDELCRSNLAAGGCVTQDEPPRLTMYGHEQLSRAMAAQLADTFTRPLGGPYDREATEALRDTLLALCRGTARAIERNRGKPDPEADGLLP